MLFTCFPFFYWKLSTMKGQKTHAEVKYKNNDDLGGSPEQRPLIALFC